ncbi:phage tail tape measure protein [Clostridium tertium]
MAGANIKIGASSSEFQTQMREVTRQLKLVSSECGVATEKAKLFGNAQEKLSSVQKELTTKIQAQNQIIGIYKDRIAGINSEIEKEKNKQAELSQKIEDVTKKKKESIETTGKDSKETKAFSEELKKLKEEYAKNERAIDSSNTKLVDATTKMNNAEKSVLQNKRALEDINKEINNLKIEKVTKGLEEVSEKTGKLANNLGKASLGVAAAGVALGKMALDTNNDFNVLQGKLGATSEEAERLKVIAQNVYDNGFGESIADSVESLTLLQTNLKSTKNWSDETKEATLEQIMTINELFGTQTEEITKTLAVMQNSGLTDDINSALDVITVGFQKGGDYSGELLDTLREYSPQFVKLGLSADEAMNYLITGADNGAFNLDKVGDAMKEFSIRAIDGSNTTIEGFQLLNLNADEMAKKFSLGGESAKGAFSQVVQAISSVEDPLIQSQIGVNLFGTMWEDLGPQVITSLGTVTGGIEGVEDATLKAGEQINNSFSNQMTIATREMRSSLIPLGSEVLNLAQVAMPALKDILDKVTGFLKNLNSEQRQMIVSGAGVLFSVAASVKGISMLTSGIKDGIKAYKNFKDFGGKAIDVVKDFGGKALDGAKAASTFAMNLGKSAIEFGKTAVQAGVSATQFVAHKVATIASTIATNTMAAAQAALNFVMSLNPITLIIIGITALIATIVLLWNKCEWFRNLCIGLFEALKSAWDITVNFFKTIWEGFVAAFKIAWDIAVLYFKVQIEAWKIAFEVVVNAIKFIWEGACNIIRNVWNIIVNVLRTSWEGWSNIFQGVTSAISSIWQGVTSTISSVWSGIVEGIKHAWKGIISPFESVANAIGNIWQGIRGMFKLPHFTISGTLNPLKWGEQGVPSIGVEWYYKGGIFKSPTILGGIGVGDAFNGQGSNAEAVVPLDEMYRKIDNIVNNAITKSGMKIEQNIYINGDGADPDKVAKASKKALRDLALGM